MVFGRKKACLRGLSELRDMDYSKVPRIGQLYTRILNGKKQLGEVLGKNLSAVTKISALNLALVHDTERMGEISDTLAAATDEIVQAEDEINRVASAIADQHEELTSTILAASEESAAIYRNIETGQEALTKIKDLSDGTITESNELKQNMEKLSGVIDHINEVIGGINSISEQTNLLALNASIEAARAGEAGRGFAVVAEEIRKLAEQTKEMTANMGEFVNRIKQASALSAESANVAVEMLENMSGQIKEVWEMNDENQKSVGRISDSVSSMASLSEEISSAIDEMTDQSERIGQQCGQQQEEAHRLLTVGTSLKAAITPVSEVEQELDEAVKIMGKMGEDVFYEMENEEFLHLLNRAPDAHRAWLDSLKAMVAQREVRPIQTDETRCGLGHLCGAVVPRNEEALFVWNRLCGKHKTFHQFGQEALDAVAAGEQEQAEEVCLRAEGFLQELTADIQELEHIIENLDIQGLHF